MLPIVNSLIPTTMKITNSFLVVSNFNNDISWVPEYTDNYVIYNKIGEIPKNIDSNKVIESSKLGCAAYDWCKYISDNYENLPDMVQLVKGNVFPRHLSQESYDKLCNNNYFTPIEDYKENNPIYPRSIFSCDGGWMEFNDSWYANHLKSKYFYDYNDFLSFVYQDPFIPLYIRFAPGGCYIVSKMQIQKIPK